MNDERDPSVLLERARQGDEEALEHLLAAVQPQLYRFSMKMCRHTADAEDVLQDSMIALARSFRDFRGNSSLATWLFTITRSFCIKKRRKSKFAPDREESLDQITERGETQLPSSEPSPHQQAESTELWQQIQSAIQGIETVHREVLLLRDIEGLSAKEVAQIVGISVPAVKSRLHRARRELRELLTDSQADVKPGCPDIRKIYSMHLEGDLSAELCSTMEAHVETCAVCAQECKGLKETLQACSGAPDQVPAAVERRIDLALRRLLRSEQP